MKDEKKEDSKQADKNFNNACIVASILSAASIIAEGKKTDAKATAKVFSETLREILLGEQEW